MAKSKKVREESEDIVRSSMSELILFLLFFFLILMGSLASVQGVSNPINISSTAGAAVPGSGQSKLKSSSPPLNSWGSFRPYIISLQGRIRILQRNLNNASIANSNTKKQLGTALAVNQSLNNKWKNAVVANQNFQPDQEGDEKNCLRKYTGKKGKYLKYHPVVFELRGNSIFVRKRETQNLPAGVAKLIEQYGWGNLVGNTFSVAELIQKTRRIVFMAEKNECYFSSNVEENTNFNANSIRTKRFWKAFESVLRLFAPDNPNTTYGEIQANYNQ